MTAQTKVIKVYQKNTVEIVCYVKGLQSLSGYTPYITIKEDYDKSIIFEKTGSVNNTDVVFKIDPSDNDISPGTYLYEITITDGTDNYTVIQNKYIVLDSVKY